LISWRHALGKIPIKGMSVHVGDDKGGMQRRGAWPMMVKLSLHRL
jgi:hypothetical protein